MTAINQKTVLGDRSTGAHLLLAGIKGSRHARRVRAGTGTRDKRGRTRAYTGKRGGKGEWPCLEVHFINEQRRRAGRGTEGEGRRGRERGEGENQ